MSHDRSAGLEPAPVVALHAQATAQAWAEEIYNQMSDLMHEALDDIRNAHGSDMCRLVMQALARLETEVCIAGEGATS